KLVNSWEVSDEVSQPQSAKIAVDWFKAKFQKTLREIDDNYKKYRISDALMATYKLVWDDYCSWFLEMVKPAFGQPMDRSTYEAVTEILEENLKILHPFVPFISEEIWQSMKSRTEKEALIIATWPKMADFDASLIEEFSIASEVISGIRSIRKEKNISFKDQIELQVMNNENAAKTFDPVIEKLG
ncbi:class I tRNA ligase family protein, partial [Salinimicrobium oceani]